MNTQSATSAAAPAAVAGNRGTVVALAMTALFLAAMDSTAVGTLLPFIKAQMNDAVLYPWLLSGFILTSVVASPIAGKIADTIGEKMAMQLALALFLAGSIAVWLAGSMPALVCARALQGAGAGAVTVTTYVIIGKLFNDRERGKMQGALSLVWGLAAILGPLLGALVHQQWGWRMVFLLNVPCCLAIMALLWTLYPGQRGRDAGAATLDPPTLLGFAASMAALLLLMMATSLRLDATAMAIVAAVAVVGLAVQVVRVRADAGRSLVPVAFLTRRAFAVPALLTLIASVVLYGSVTLLPLYLGSGQADGGGPVRGGLMVMASALGWVVGSAVCGGGLNRFGFRIATVFGTGALLVGALLLHRAHVASPAWWFVAAQAAIGIGIGFTATAMLVLVQNRSPANQIGGATAGVHLCRNVGAALGINAVAALQIAAMGASRGGTAWQHSFQQAFLLLVALAAVALPLALTLPHKVERAR